jgi:HD-GYP domain-containing protein (c-di-GMP phosphodiesterase class II)
LFNAEAVFLISADERTIIKVTKEGGFTQQTNIPHKPPETDLLKFNTTSLNIINNNKLGDSVDSIELPPEFNRAKKQLRESQRVLVCATDPLYEQSGHGTSMWGPLKENDDRFAIIGITRRETSFVAGDMLLFDSALTFGGNILSNLHLIEQLKQTSFESVRALVNALDQKDSYTCGHAERVGFLAKVTGQHMNLSTTQLQTLEWAGLLHDVGKIGIPEEVLNKPGPLSPEEFALIKEHSSRGYEVLKPVASLEPVLEVVLHHHESPDGTGYPTELKGDEIPLLARIIHVVDVFDALTSTRSYRQSYNFDQAVEILKKDAGIKLDAEIVTSFIEVWSQLPNTHPEEYERWFGLAKETKT